MGKDYIELEYIESTGTQYIDTGIIPNNDINLHIQYNQLTGSGSCLGCRLSDNSIRYFIATKSNYYTFFFGNVSDEPNTYVQSNKLIDNIVSLKISSTQFIIDDTVIKTYTLSSLPNYNIYLFALNTQGNANAFSLVQVYSFKIYNNNVLIRDLIPVKRKSDNKICMYDKVSSIYFLNQGTGEFIAGPEIPEPTFYDSLILINSKITNLLNLTDTILNKNPKVIPVEYDTYVTIESSPKYKVGINENATSLKILTYDDTSKYDRRAILKFDLSKYIFNINKISKVELWAYLFANDIPSRQQTHPVRRIIKDWNSDTLFDLTYMSNTIEDRMVSLNTSGSGYGWRTADITNLFKGWINNTYENYGLVIDNNRGQPEAGGYWASMQYYSKEADNDYKPKIVITYNK